METKKKKAEGGGREVRERNESGWEAIRGKLVPRTGEAKRVRGGGRNERWGGKMARGVGTLYNEDQ